MPFKTFFIKTVFLYRHLSLSTGSKEIFIKKEKKRLMSPKVVEGPSLGEMSPKKYIFFIAAISYLEGCIC